VLGFATKKNAKTQNLCSYWADSGKGLANIRTANIAFSYKLAIFNNLYGLF
jgi:hypothetical protein